MRVSLCCTSSYEGRPPISMSGRLVVEGMLLYAWFFVNIKCITAEQTPASFENCLDMRYWVTV